MSASQPISFREPYLIGDRLNTSNRSTRTAVEFGDLAAVGRIAEVQIANGADALDISACASGGRESKHLNLMIRSIRCFAQPVVCSIDTQDPAIVGTLRSSLIVPPILNCYSGLLDSEEEMQAAIRSTSPIAGVVAVCVNFRGTDVISARRLDIAKRMASELANAGVDTEQIIFDPVTMPSSAGAKAEQVTLDTIRLLRELFPLSGVLCAVSNYSYGLQKRRDAEHAYAARAKAYGASVFLINALDKQLCELARQAP